MFLTAPLRLLLDSSALIANWRWLASHGQGATACGAAVKADGYGLGAREIVARLAAAGCRDFFCATWAEAEALGALPDGAQLAVLHGVRREDMAIAVKSAARPVLNSVDQVARWRDAGGGPCDVMIDTGMNRLGLAIEEAMGGALSGLRIETLMSHLACADEPDHPLNAVQLAAFQTLKANIPAARYSLANSAGILLGPDYAFDLMRPGIALYGGVPVPAARGIKAVAAIQAQVLQVRSVSAGGAVGYGATWHAAADARVAILNLGYADGYMRQFAPDAFALAGACKLPLAGRISMDLTAVDVSGADVGEGDWLDIDFNLPRLAKRSGLSQYEILTGLNPRFERRWT